MRTIGYVDWPERVLSPAGIPESIAYCWAIEMAKADAGEIAVNASTS